MRLALLPQDPMLRRIPVPRRRAAQQCASPLGLRSITLRKHNTHRVRVECAASVEPVACTFTTQYMLSEVKRHLTNNKPAAGLRGVRCFCSSMGARVRQVVKNNNAIDVRRMSSGQVPLHLI